MEGAELMQKMLCSKIGNCRKIEMVLDKDLAGDWQYSEAIKSVCAKCKEGVYGDVEAENKSLKEQLDVKYATA